MTPSLTRRRPGRGQFGGGSADTGWIHGTGPEANGPTVAIVMAMTGRTAALNDLTGDGVTLLRDRA
jgi:hypothetical protein